MKFTHLFPIYFSPEGEGGGGTTPPPDPKNDGNGAGGDGDKKTVTHSQDELNALFADRAKQAKEKATKDLLAALGVENVDAAKTALAEFATLKQSQMSEAEKAKAELDKLAKERDGLKTERDAATARANELLMKSAVIAEAMKPAHNIQEEALADVWQFVDKSLLEIDEAGNVKGVEKAVKQVTEGKKYLLKSTPAPKGTPQRANGKTITTPNAQPEQKQPAVRVTRF